MGARLQGFASSIRKDMDAVAKLPECMDGKSVSSFVDYCQDCPGQLLVSGIGECAILYMYIYKLYAALDTLVLQ